LLKELNVNEVPELVHCGKLWRLLQSKPGFG